MDHSSRKQHANTFPQHPTATPGLTRSACGAIMLKKSPHEGRAVLGQAAGVQRDKAG
tara:strand:- start:7755 stop:7925 length:171 start_codon:yes stop_codon:yes gene_type:complete